MAVADQFCLKWNNFQSSIITAFESLQSTEDLADVTLTCEGLNVKAHKIILSACSTYFRAVFKENPCPHPVVILKDVLYVDLLAILNFMYHGEVLIVKDQLRSFLQTAETLQVSGLIGCSNFPIKNVLSNVSTDPLEPKKAGKVRECSEPPTKKQKSNLQKNKAKQSSTVVIDESSNLDIQIDSPPKEKIDKEKAEKEKVNLDKTSERDRFERVDVEKIKMEYDDSDNVLMKNEISDTTCSLEKNLEAKEERPSILERSLTNIDRSPSMPLYTLEPSINLRQELNKSVTVTRKPPDRSDSSEAILKQKLTEFSIPCGSESSLDKNDMGYELLGEVQPHHSSQCGICPHCGKIYSNQSALKYHVRLVHSDLTNMYCCHLCPESFDYREGYKKHMFEVHNVRN